MPIMARHSLLYTDQVHSSKSQAPSFQFACGGVERDTGAMPLARRHFLHSAGLAAAGFFLTNRASAATTVNVSLTLATQDQVVLDWLRGFATQVRLVGSSVLARLRGDTKAPAHWIVAVSRLGVLPEVFGTANFAGLYTSGSTAFFTVGGCEVSVEILPMEDFTSRLKDLGRGAFGYDYETLSYDPISGQLTDPLRSRSVRGMRVTRTTRDIAASFAQMLDGLISSRQLGLERSDAFRRLRSRVLSYSGAKPAVADAVCTALMERFVTWVSAAPVEEIVVVLTSRLVAGSLRTAFDIEARPAVAAVKASLAGDSAPNPDVWVQGLFGASPAALGRLRNGNRFDQLRAWALLPPAA